MKRTRAETVVWIASYPKSGNTWVQTVVRHAGRAYGFPAEDLDVYRMKAAGKQPHVVEGIQPALNATHTAVLKTHAGFTPGSEPHAELKLRTVGFAYVMRNPLDILLSYINFTRIPYERNQDNEPFRQNLFVDLLGYDKPIPYAEWVDTTLEDIPRARLDHALARFGELDTGIPGMHAVGGTWLQHCLSWHEAGRSVPSVVLRYEDLLGGASEFLPLRRLFTFSRRELTGAVATINRRQHDLLGKRIFFNKMRAYYFPEYFSAAETSRFLTKFEQPLRELGYGNLFQKAAI